jgi:AcrR family transcriptional regulator
MSRAREPRAQQRGQGRGGGRGRTEPDEPIWIRPEPTGRRAPRSRDDIAEAAVAVADADGLEAVSMRRVASELGLGTMSLYHYVRSKGELLDLMGDWIMGGQLVDDADLRRGWREGLTAIARATRANFERHPWMGGAMSPRPSTIPGPNALRHVDQSLAAVADLGLDVRGQMEIIGVVDDYVIGFVVRSQRVAEQEEGLAADTIAEWMDKAFGHLRSQIESGEFPHLQGALEANRAAGGHDEDLGRMASSEERFERGLELLLDGIEAKFAAPVKRRRGR